MSSSFVRQIVLVLYCQLVEKDSYGSFPIDQLSLGLK